MGGFGKIFFTKGGIKRGKEGFGWEEREAGSYIFLKSFEGVEENSKFYGGMYFWGSGVRREKGKGNFWVEEEMGCNMEYSLMECFL